MLPGSPRDTSTGPSASEQTPNQSLRSTTLQMLRCVSSPPGSTLSKNNHTNKDVAEPPASALPECSARPGPAGHAPASAHHASAARRARTPTASHSHPHGSPQMSHVIPRHAFSPTPLKPRNFNDHNSNPERPAGELRATLVGTRSAGRTTPISPRCPVGPTVGLMRASGMQARGDQ